jgi:hypothetical protein
MRKKKRLGIKFPNGEVEEIVFSSPSSSGVVFSLTHSDKHVTLVEERNAISTHTTEQNTKKHIHLGRLSKNEMTDKLWLEILKPRKLKDSELDQTMMYFTKKMGSLFNMPDDVCFKVTDDKSMRYLDLDAIFKYTYSFLQDLQRSPDAYLGLCQARQMLSSDNIECGLLENGKFIVRYEKELYKMDLSLLREALFMQNGSVSENPMLNILKTLGITFLQENLMKRFQEIIKVQQDDQ